MYNEKRSAIAKKKFGQNFLHNITILEKISEAMPSEYEIIEIGPGLGDLTRRLVAKKEVTAYEIDTDLVSRLLVTFNDEITQGKLRLVVGDVMEIWGESLTKSPYAIVANLPYYIATAIILRALRDSMCRVLVVMVQKEVAQKFCAKVGNSEYSSLSVLTQIVGEGEILFDVPPECFDPAPKVMSSVIKITKSVQNEWDESFAIFLSKAFQSPRKTLIKNLGQSFPKETLLQIWEEIALSLTVRPHEVSPSLFVDIYERLK